MPCHTLKPDLVRYSGLLLKNPINVGTVLRMLAAYVGEETFLRGVTIYLKKHLYANSVSKDLWAGIAESSGAYQLILCPLVY